MSLLIDVISSLKTAAEFSDFLENAIKVSISWHGKRMMSIKGYKGEIEIHTLARQFLQAAPMTESRPPLKERLAWYDLWDGIERIYQRSDEELQKTWTYKYYVPALEGRAHLHFQDGDSMAVFKECESIRNRCLAFTRKEFTALWPDRAEDWKSDFKTDEPGLQRHIVSRGMLAEACRFINNL